MAIPVTDEWCVLLVFMNLHSYSDGDSQISSLETRRTVLILQGNTPRFPTRAVHLCMYRAFISTPLLSDSDATCTNANKSMAATVFYWFPTFPNHHFLHFPGVEYKPMPMVSELPSNGKVCSSALLRLAVMTVRPLFNCAPL
jgi:hypothetical protein